LCGKGSLVDAIRIASGVASAKEMKNGHNERINLFYAFAKYRIVARGWNLTNAVCPFLAGNCC
jgi:hypothetical protein